MRLKSLAAAVAASSLLLASAPAAAAASKLSVVSSVDRAGASQEGESELGGQGFIGFAIVFGLGAAAGALIYSLLDGNDEEPVSP